jgi:hypothetical protein
MTRESLIPALDEALASEGQSAAVEVLVRDLEERGEWRALLDALLLRARLDLGLPTVLVEPLSSLEEPARTQYEDRYVAALRHVGTRLLAAGDIPGAWPYFRMLGEKEPVAAALDALEVGRDDPQIGALIDVAFQSGVHPRRGYRLLLDQYGTCSAITAFEQLPMDEAVRADCAAMLVRTLHEQLTANVRADLEQRGESLPSPTPSLAQMLKGRDHLLADDAYHIDISHLASIVRLGPLLGDETAIGLAADLCAYGRRLSSRLRYDDLPPFESTYEDHAFYLNAMLGSDIDAALDHFRRKLPQPNPEGESDGDTRAAEVLVRLLARLGRLDEAIDVATEHLSHVPEGALSCPSLSTLCLRAGRLDQLAEVSRRLDDPVRYLAARIDRADFTGRARS